MQLPFIRALVERDLVESTNDLAREFALAGAHDLPLAIRALRQTRGRGRGSHTWWSDAGSLTCTLLIDPNAHALRREHEPTVALATAVAIVDAISEFSPRDRLGLRWPNDVELGGRKLGGILPERIVTPFGPRLAIGIGLNVTTDLSKAPDDVRRLAVSLAETCARAPTTDAIFLSILQQFANAIDRLAQDDHTLASRWDSLDLLRGCLVEVDLGPRIVAGVGRGIDRAGALCLEGDGEVVRLFGGQVLR